MISIFNQLFLRNLWASIATSALLMTGALWMTQSLRFIKIIVNHYIGFSEYLALITFILPDLLVVILPLAVLVGVAFVYIKSINDHEMVVWQSSGMTNWQIARPGIVVGIFGMLFSFLINLYLLPIALQKFRFLEHKLRHEFSSSILDEGQFTNLRNLMIYIKQKEKTGELKGIFIYHYGDDPYAVIAQSGRFDANSMVLQLRNGQKQQNQKTIFFDNLEYALHGLLDNAPERIVKPYEKSIQDLFNPPEMEPAVTAQWKSEAHQRIINPLLVFAFALLAIALPLLVRFKRQERKWLWLALLSIAGLIQGTVITLLNLNAKFFFSLPVAYGIVLGFMGYLFIRLRN